MPLVALVASLLVTGSVLTASDPLPVLPWFTVLVRTLPPFIGLVRVQADFREYEYLSHV